MNRAAGIGEGDRPAAEVDHLFSGKLGHVPGAGNGDRFPIEGLAFCFQHLLGKIDAAVAGSFRTDQAPAPVQRLARENTGELIP